MIEIICNICGWEVPRDDMAARKKAHEARHLRVDKKAVGGGNNIYGVVKWL